MFADPKPPKSCPFLPPVMTPNKMGTGVDVRPIPCLGKPESEKGGGCAAWKLCQGTPGLLADIAEGLARVAAEIPTAEELARGR